MATVTLLNGTIQTSLSATDLASLAAGAGVLSAAFDPAGYPYARVEVLANMGSAPAANTTIDVYIVQSVDAGTTYEDGAGGTTPVLPAGPAVFVAVLRAVTGAQRRITPVPGIVLPSEPFKLLLVNSAGVAMAASGSTLRIKALTQQF